MKLNRTQSILSGNKFLALLLILGLLLLVSNIALSISYRTTINTIRNDYGTYSYSRKEYRASII